MSKRTQKDSGEERVTAKSTPMMNLVSRCSERAPDVLASTASESPGKTRHGSQLPLSAWTEQHLRTRRPVVCPQRAHQFVIEDDETESEMSLKSGSFLHRVNDQVRKRQKQSSKDATKDSDKHSVIWGMFMSSTLRASVFMGENYSHNFHSIKNAEDLTMKQMFDISEKLISEQSDEIYGVNTINWEDSSWKHLFLVGGEKVISLSHTKVYVFSDSVLCLGKMNENPQ